MQQRWAWRIAVAALVGAWLVASKPVDAQAGLPLELQWTAPAECGSGADVRSELERIARVRPGYALTALTARASVEHHRAIYRLQLSTEHAGTRGTRQLEARDCNTLVRTLTLVLAVAFGGGVELAEQAQAPEIGENEPRDDAAPSADTPPNVPPPSAADITPAPAATHAPALALFLGTGAQLGLLPTAALTLTLGAEIELGTWSLGLRLTALPSLAERGAADLRARFDGLAASVQGCRQLPLATLSLGLCAGARAAALRGRASSATNSDANGSATAPWYALAATATLGWPRDSWISARLEAALAASLDRPRFVIDGFGTVHRVPLLVADFGAWMVVQL